MSVAIRIGLRCDGCDMLMQEELVRPALVPYLARSNGWMAHALEHIARHVETCPAADPDDQRLRNLCSEAAELASGRVVIR